MFQLPDLPYAKDALQPVISAETMGFHHDKHHAKYFKVTNDLMTEEKIDFPTLEEVIQTALRKGRTKLYNNAAQAWNHSFFWECMSPDGQRPGAELAAAIKKGFGDLATLKSRFVEMGNGQFGSGWVWLTATADGLRVETTHDAGNHLDRRGVTPLLVCDVWEHAYYLDHQNDREGFLNAWFDDLANWRLADAQFAAARGDGEAWKHPPQTEAKKAA